MIKFEKLNPDGSIQKIVELEDGRWQITLPTKRMFFITGEYIIPSNPNLEKEYFDMLESLHDFPNDTC